MSLTIKLRRANNFVINIIAYSEYDSEVELMNNRKLFAMNMLKKSMQKLNEISLAHTYHQGVSPQKKNEMNMAPFATQKS